MRPIPAVKSKGTPEMERGWVGRGALPPLCFRWTGRATAPMETGRLQQTVKEPGSPAGRCLRGQRLALREKKGNEKRPAMKKARNHLVAGPLDQEIGRENACGLLPCAATSARVWSGILETITQPLWLAAIALQIRCALLRWQSLCMGWHGRQRARNQRPAHGHGALAGAVEDGGAAGVHGGLSAVGRFGGEFGKDRES